MSSRSVAIIAVITAILIAEAPAQLGVPLGADVTVSAGASTSSLATDGLGTVMAVSRSEPGGGPVVAVSVDGGVTWQARGALPGGGDVTLTGLAVTPLGRWLAVWAVDDPVVEIRASHSDDAGLSWSTPIVVSAAQASKLEVVHDGANGFVASWTVNLFGNYVTHSPDGVSWAAPVFADPSGITWALYGQRIGDLVSDGRGRCMLQIIGAGGLHVVTTTDGGVTWSLPVNVDARAPASIALATDGGVWMSATTQSVFPFIHFDANVSQDFGVTWSAPTPVVPQPFGHGGLQLASDSAGNWLLAWNDGFLGVDTDVAVSRSADRGATWTPPEAYDINHLTDSLGDTPRDILALGAGSFLLPFDDDDASSCRARVLDLCPLLGPIASGTGEDLVIESDVNGFGCPTAGVKPARFNDLFHVSWRSPGGAFAGNDTIMLAQLTLSGVVPPPAFPGIALNPLVAPGVGVVVSGVVLPAGGLSAAIVVPPGVSGFDVLFQAYALTSAAGNGIFASTDVHALRGQ